MCGRPKSSAWLATASSVLLSSHFSKKVDSTLKACLVFSNSIRKTFILIPTDTSHTQIRKIKGHCKSDCFQWSDQLQTEAIRDALKITGCNCPEALSRSATLLFGSSERFLGIFSIAFLLEIYATFQIFPFHVTREWAKSSSAAYGNISAEKVEVIS